jgi:hypothetical protein
MGSHRSEPTYLSSVNCPQCGMLVPSPEAMRTPFGPVWRAKHDAYHLDWLATNGGSPRQAVRLGAWRAYAKALEDDANRARRHDRECIFEREAELAEVRADNLEAHDRIKQLEADLLDARNARDYYEDRLRDAGVPD